MLFFKCCKVILRSLIGADKEGGSPRIRKAKTRKKKKLKKEKYVKFPSSRPSSFWQQIHMQ